MLTKYFNALQMAISTYYIQDFVDATFKLLEPYNNQKLNLMISGGSSLLVFHSSLFSELNMSKWNIYFCDERIEMEHNIDEAKKLMTNFKCTFP